MPCLVTTSTLTSSNPWFKSLLIDILWLAPGALKALDELIVVWAWWRPGKSSEGVAEIRSPADEGEGGEGTDAVGWRIR